MLVLDILSGLCLSRLKLSFQNRSLLLMSVKMVHQEVGLWSDSLFCFLTPDPLVIILLRKEIWLRFGSEKGSEKGSA